MIPPSTNKHRGGSRDLAFPKCGNPREELHACRHGHEQGAVHERHAQVFIHAGGEHVMRPNHETDQRDTEGGHGDPAVAEERLADKYRQEFRDHTKTRQNKDIHGRV
jgi:hypothetical protein